MTRYVVYDVFTDTPFSGNQLAVFPDATALADHHLMDICREFNFSEVVFVYPPDDPENTARIRIFSPGREMRFAGHPTIGTAVALYDAGHGNDQILELGIGPLACHVDDNAASFVNTAPLERLGTPDPALIADCLSLRLSDVSMARHPPEIASVGNPFVLVEIASNDALVRAKPLARAMEQVLAAHPESLDCSIYAYTRSGPTVIARMFGQLGGIPEDPATGSAAAALGAYLAELEGDTSLNIRQGEVMGRPSRIRVEADRSSVTIAGKAVRVMDGTLTI